MERPNWLISGSRKDIQDADLVDIHLEGHKFTWFRSLGTDRAIEEKLDIIMVNRAWMSLFQDVNAHFLSATTSDHYLVLLGSTMLRVQVGLIWVSVLKMLG